MYSCFDTVILPFQQSVEQSTVNVVTVLDTSYNHPEEVNTHTHTHTSTPPYLYGILGEIT